VIRLPYDKGAIAAELGMARESLSRAFANLEEDAIAVRGSEVTIRDRAMLLRRAETMPSRRGLSGGTAKS